MPAVLRLRLHDGFEDLVPHFHDPFEELPHELEELVPHFCDLVEEFVSVLYAGLEDFASELVDLASELVDLVPDLEWVRQSS